MAPGDIPVRLTMALGVIGFVLMAAGLALVARRGGRAAAMGADVDGR